MFEKIAALLTERKMTFAELSRKTGISESIFSNLKNRGGKLSIDNAAKVANALDVEIGDLI